MFFRLGVGFEELLEYEEVFDWFVRNMGIPVYTHVSAPVCRVGGWCLLQLPVGGKGRRRCWCRSGLRAALACLQAQSAQHARGCKNA